MNRIRNVIRFADGVLFIIYEPVDSVHKQFKKIYIMYVAGVWLGAPISRVLYLYFRPTIVPWFDF